MIFADLAAGPLQPARTWAVSRAAFGLPGGPWAGHWAVPGAALQPPLPGAILAQNSPDFIRSSSSWHVPLPCSSCLLRAPGPGQSSERLLKPFWSALAWKDKKGERAEHFQPPQCPRSGMPLLRDAEFPGADLIPPALHLCAQAAQRDHCRKTMIPLGVLVAAALFIPF